MKERNNAKELLIEYLLSNEGRDIPREEIISQTGISKSRLSELINDIRADGYEIITPKRSGIVRLEAAHKIVPDITSRDVRQWLIILVLSKLEKATYMELICSILSISDRAYLYDKIVTDEKYSDMDIMKYLQDYNSGAKDDIDYFLPLPTLRKDLHALIESGFVDKKRMQYKGGIHVVYSLSEKSPAVLFESEGELCAFLMFYDNFKRSLSNTEPLESLYKKAASIYDWESYDSTTHIYGRSNHIDKNQLDHLNNFIKYPYKTKTLQINYFSREGEIDLNIAPGLLFYSIETNCFYLLCTNTTNQDIMQLRLDRIKSIHEGQTQNENYRASNFLTMYEEMFSAAFDSKKTHVKVLFQDFGNTKERLVSLHSKRKRSKLYEIKPPTDDIPHSIVYEDDIRGLSDFSRFLRSFGSSAIVLEPSELRDSMIEKNQKILKNYKEVINENK
jgi:predicted DNA-binding transcriptional regulator YafY/biotin operon repressor